MEGGQDWLGGPRPWRLLARGRLLLAEFRSVFDRRRGVTIGPFTVQALHGLLLAAGLSHGLLVGALGLLFLPAAAPRRPRLAGLSLAGAVRTSKIGAEEIYGDRKDHGRVVLRGDLRQRLEEPELKRRATLQSFGGVVQALGGLVLAFGRDDLSLPLPLGLGLARHRSLHPLRDLHVLDLDHADLHPHGSVCW